MSYGERSTTKIGDAIKNRDVVAIAIDIFHRLDTLMPPPMPAAPYASKPEVFRAWRSGGAIPDELKAEFREWLKQVGLRTDAIEESKRRLRSTLWAEVTLRASGQHADYAAMLTSHHRREWRIARVSDDSGEREKQISDAIKLRGTR
jgi:hypothetical protein